VLAARLLGTRIPERLTYIEWFPEFVGVCAREGVSMFFLGGAEGVAGRAADMLTQRHPGLKVAAHHGFFDKRPESAENRHVIETINLASPDILLVGFGMPLQEQWIQANLTEIDARVVLPCGAALELIAGTLRRPPEWMARCGLEWLGRLAMRPGRLWRRYLLGNPLFFSRVLRERLSRRWH